MPKTHTANSKPAGKRKAPPGAWKPGQSGNPAGAPKRGESWQEIIKRVGELTPGEAAQRSLELAQQLLKIGDGVTLKEAVILRVYASLLFEPQPGLLNAFMDRAEGKVTQPIDVNDLREKKDSEIVDEFGKLVDIARARASAEAGGGDEAPGAGNASGGSDTDRAD